MLHEVDESIKNLLFGELKKTAAGLVQGEDQIVIGPPTGEDDGRARIHLFLHDVHENLSLRDPSFEVRRGANDWEIGKSRKATRLNLSYLLTAHAGTPAEEHRMLGEALGVLLRNGFVPEEHLVGSLKPFAEEAVVLSVAQRDHWAHADGPKVWQATGTPLRPFVGIVAAAMFDPFETRTVRLVREALLAVGQGTGPGGPDREMDVRSLRVSAGGTVSDSKGDPIADAIVRVEARPEQTTTDAQGAFFLQGLPPGSHRLTFSKRGYVVDPVAVTVPPRGQAGDLDLVSVQMRSESDADRATTAKEEGELALVGTLRYADGRPAPYIPIRIGNRTAVTDGEGGYRFSPVPEGGASLVAEIPGTGETSIKAKDGVARLPKPRNG
jgi:hypothetical protein